MTIAFDGKLISALVNGKKIKDNILYNIVMIDYLAEGNDGMAALNRPVNRVETELSMRDVLMDYIGRLLKRGVLLNS